MAPQNAVSCSQNHLIAQAGLKLLDTVRESGSSPGPLAMAILDLMENSAKLQEFDEMLAVAKQEAMSEEAKTWQEISLMTLQYCRQGLVEQQQRGIQSVCKLVEGGSSLLSGVAEQKVELPTLLEAAEVPMMKLPPPAEASPSLSPQTPPGIWKVGSPPGLASPPPGLLAPPPGFDGKGPSPGSAAPKKMPPWRSKKQAKPSAEVKDGYGVVHHDDVPTFYCLNNGQRPSGLCGDEEEPEFEMTPIEAPVAAASKPNCGFAINFDAFSSDEE